MRAFRRRAGAGMAALAALSLVASACGGSSSSTSSSGGSPSSASSGGSSSGGSIAKQYHLAGAHFAVGSKEFTEENILGEMTVDALKAAGGTATFQALTGSTTTRTALTSGRIDMYWEYDGTAWLDYLQHTAPIASAQGQYQAVANQDMSQNHIKWLAPTPFSDGYGVAVRSKAPGALGKLDTDSQLASYVKANPNQSTFCGASEFHNRSDGLPALEKTYGFTFPSGNIKTVDLSLDYTSVAKGNPCNLAEIFTTDGRIQALNLKVLNDDKTAFGNYQASLTVRNAVYSKYPSQLSGIFDAISAKLTTPVIQNLNKEVDVDGMTASAVAATWLHQNGFTG